MKKKKIPTIFLKTPDFIFLIITCTFTMQLLKDRTKYYEYSLQLLANETIFNISSVP